MELGKKHHKVKDAAGRLITVIPFSPADDTRQMKNFRAQLRRGART